MERNGGAGALAGLLLAVVTGVGFWGGVPYLLYAGHTGTALGILATFVAGGVVLCRALHE